MFKKNSEKIIPLFILKSVFSAIISVLLLSFIASQILYKLDLKGDMLYSVISLIICFISSFIVSGICVFTFKNNGVLMGILSEIPLIIISAFNLVFNSNTLAFFLIKVLIIILTGAFCGYYITGRNKRIRIK